MRRVSCVVLIMLAILSSGVPATTAPDRMAGIKGGLNLANLTGEDVFNNSSSPGGIAGAFARYGLSEKWSVQPEVLFAMRGAEFSAEGIEAEQQFEYLEIPVLARVAWRNQGKFEPSLFAGPSLGILLGNKIVDGAEIDLKDGSKDVDFGLVVGAGLDYTMGPGAILLDIRYERGLTSWSEDLDTKHSVASFMIGYGYRR